MPATSEGTASSRNSHCQPFMIVEPSKCSRISPETGLPTTPASGIARMGRLTVAAQRLGIDHSTLSRRLSGLEAAFGARLFDRRPSGFVLTAAGERLLADAERMERMAIAMRSHLDEACRQVTGTVRLVRSYWLITHAETRDLVRVKLIMDFLIHPATRAGNAFRLAG
ncbi:HTH-type transcriptional regulator HdfR [Methylobacterium dankookense]|uniref:HTH-type transcriptional regulator HdfR n=4 Tax=Methylobacterium dankookense TaxID=560405 RepID=A0A564FTV3_9HYPH|nr:HTH-type transcriptional regulator HdfR [Methylobacterium dankookense]